MTSNHASLAQIADALRAHQRFVIVSHLRPDGDALGCTVALGLSLRTLGKDVTLWNEDGMLDKLRFLPGSELVSRPLSRNTGLRRARRARQPPPTRGSARRSDPSARPR